MGDIECENNNQCPFATFENTLCFALDKLHFASAFAAAAIFAFSFFFNPLGMEGQYQCSLRRCCSEMQSFTRFRPSRAIHIKCNQALDEQTYNHSASGSHAPFGERLNRSTATLEALTESL